METEVITMDTLTAEQTKTDKIINIAVMSGIIVMAVNYLISFIPF